LNRRRGGKAKTSAAGLMHAILINGNDEKECRRDEETTAQGEDDQTLQKKKFRTKKGGRLCGS